MTAGDVIVLAGLVVVTALVLVAGARRGRLLTAAVAAVAGLAALWAGAAVASATRWRDADGWVDCHPSCSPLQDAVGTVLVFGAGLWLLVALVALVAGLRRWDRGHPG